MVAVLGISAFYHDAAAAIVVDGHIVAAAQEERFTRIKHDQRMPEHAIKYCLQQAALSASELDYVTFYEKPLRKSERLLETFVSASPWGYRSFRHAVPMWINEKLHIPRAIRRALNNEYDGPIVFLDHHESHAASAFYPSPFREAAILTIDGVGEWTTSCTGMGRDNRIELMEEIRFPHSLGLLYSAFTYYLGFRVNSGEYKVMGLAPYGAPVYAELIREHLIEIKEDGSFQLDLEYFNYCRGLTMTSSRFHQLFGGLPREPESQLTQREMDLAASVQHVTEEVILKMANHLHRQTGAKHLVMAGGVALNCVANGRMLRESAFEQIWVQPASGDAGGALGAAMFVWHQLLENNRITAETDSQQGSFLGPAYSDIEIRSVLDRENLLYQTYNNSEELCGRVAELLTEGKIVGWFQGRMEFGPRALGARSILAEARHGEMQSRVNLKIKFRESFRPFAPVVLQEYVADYFDLPSGHDSPYMSFAVPVNKSVRLPLSNDDIEATGLARLSVARSTIPAVTHVDFSARVQTVDQVRNPLLHELLSKYYRRTSFAVLLNTSFNVRGEPIVCAPEDAVRCFQKTELDVLVIGNQIVLRSEQAESWTSAGRTSQRRQMQLD